MRTARQTEELETLRGCIEPTETGYRARLEFKGEVCTGMTRSSLQDAMRDLYDEIKLKTDYIMRADDSRLYSDPATDYAKRVKKAGWLNTRL